MRPAVGPFEVGRVLGCTGDAADLLHPLDQRLGFAVEQFPSLDQGVAQVTGVLFGDCLVVLHALELVLDPRLLVEDFLQRGHSTHLPSRSGYQTSPLPSRSSTERRRYSACW